jgi:hypothetical protein
MDIVKQSTCLTIHFDDIVIHRTVGTIPKSIIKIVERGKVDTLNTKIHDRSHSCLCKKSDGDKLILWA